MERDNYQLDPMDLSNECDLDVLLQRCENVEERAKLCDSYLCLQPGGRLIPVISLLLNRLALFNVHVQYSNIRNMITLNRPLQSDIPKRYIEMKVDLDDQETFCHLVHALHLKHRAMKAYVKTTLRSNGLLLPILEMAGLYQFLELAALVREEIALLVRQLLDTGQFQDAFEILIFFLDRRSCNDVDGDFENKSSQELQRHPLIRQVVHFLRLAPHADLAPHVELMAHLPSLTLIHLILFPGGDFKSKQQLFASTLIAHAHRIKERNRLYPHIPNTTMEESMLVCIQHSCQEIIEQIHKVWSRSLEPIHSTTTTRRRTMVRSHSSEEYCKNSTATPRKWSSDVERPRALSQPETLQSSTERAVDLSNTPDDPMEECSSSQSLSSSPASHSLIPHFDSDSEATTLECSPLTYLTRFDALEHSVVFALKRSKTNTSILHYQSTPLSVPIQMSPLGHAHCGGDEPHLVLSLRLDLKLKQIDLLASLVGYKQRKATNVTYVVDWDVDPMLWSGTLPLPAAPTITQPSSILFTNKEPLIIARHVFDRLPSNVSTTTMQPMEAAEETPFHVSVYLKMLF